METGRCFSRVLGGIFWLVFSFLSFFSEVCGVRGSFLVWMRDEGEERGREGWRVGGKEELMTVMIVSSFFLFLPISFLFPNSPLICVRILL